MAQHRAGDEGVATRPGGTGRSHRFRVMALIGATLILLVSGSPPAIGNAAGVEAEAVPAGAIWRDVTYSVRNDVELKLDVYHGTVNGPTPLVIYLHGGGWTTGDKAGAAELDYLQDLLARGYSVASVNYRLAPAYPFPASIIDVKDAIRFLRANAAEFKIRPDRIALIGFSAGAHLAMLAGVADATAGWDSGSYAEVSSEVQAVVAIAGLADLTDPVFQPRHAEHFAQVFPSARRLLAASPIIYLDSADPPFLIFHGELDPVIPLSHAHLFDAALTESGIPHKLIVMEDTKHVMPKDGPAADAYHAAIVNFVQARLGPASGSTSAQG